MARDRLNALDVAFLRMVPQELCVAALLCDPPERGATPGYDDVWALVEERLGRSPRYRQCVTRVPHGLDRPVWIDVDDFDLRRHVRRAEVGAGGGSVTPRAFEQLCEQASIEPFDYNHPLWRIHVVEGIEGDRLGLICVVHHAIADAIAALAFFAALLTDLTPEPLRGTPAAWRPEPEPSERELVADALAARAERLRAAGIAVARDLGSRERLSELAGGAAEVARATAAIPALVRRELAERVDPAPFNRPTQRDEAPRLVFWEASLPDVLRLGHESGAHATVNDIVLAGLAQGLRRWFEHAGAPVPDLRVMLPVDVAGTALKASAGRTNAVGAVYVPLPMQERRMLARVRAISARTHAFKRRGDAAPSALFTAAVRAVPNRVSHRARLWLLRNPWSSNAILSNFRGPSAPLYVLGGRITTVHPIATLPHETGVALTVVSYAGRLSFTLEVNGSAMPNPEVVAEGVQAAFEELAAEEAAAHA